MTQTKACTKCTLVTPLGGFYKKAVAKDGLESECKVCTKARRRAYYAENRERENAYSREYKAGHRDEIAASNRAYIVTHKAELDAYSREYNRTHAEEKSAYNRAYHADNSAELNAKSRAYNDVHADRLKVYSREYRATHKPEKNASRREAYAANPEVFLSRNQKRHARKLGNGVFEVSAKEIARVRLLPCVHCGATENIQVDHIIPLSKGGPHSIGNLMSLCGSCNSSKHNSFYSVFKARQAKILTATEMRQI